MTDYPAQYPWGPHGPKVDTPSSVMPNPTIPSVPPTFPAWDAGAATSSASIPTGGGGGTFSASPHMIGGRSFGTWMRNLAIGGAVLGCLGGVLSGYALHQSPSLIGVMAARFGVAGAAVGASIPPAFRFLGSMLRAAVWLVIAVILWGIAMAAVGQLNWLTGPR